MKKNYLKSIGLVMSVCIFLSSTISCLDNKSYTQLDNKLYTRVDTKLDVKKVYSKKFIDSVNIKNIKAKRMDTLDNVLQDIESYQMWLNFFPESVSVDIVKDDLIVKYTERKFPLSDFEFLKFYNDSMLKVDNSYKFSRSNIPFHKKLDRSYFISREDIDAAFYNYEDANGINVYLAMNMNKIKHHGIDSLKSHLYVVPTLKTNETLVDQLITYDGIEYALDLTDPCPALCACSSPLHKLNITKKEKEELYKKWAINILSLY
ncbi:hypothetical protein [Kordia sp.]|uniref:hypothetical protein n=1 Tax=Kordia sp. TaxID=1965332 RepID=UPI003D6C16B4